jgi:hypothetical protein
VTAPFARGLSFYKTRGQDIIHALAILVILSGLLGAVTQVVAGPGDLNVTVGGITRSQSGGSGEYGRRIDKPQTGLGNLTIPDTTRRQDNPTGGTSFSPDTKNIGGGSPLSSGNTGAYPHGSGTYGQQPNGQFCSSSDVTIGESKQSQFHCSNTVNGTLRQ